jgi:ubiquitin-protein ligase E3 A
MKRANAKKLIEKYFYQLTTGCGDSQCKNRYCASGENFLEKFDNPNQAAIRAIQLYTEEAELCNEIDIPKSKVQKTIPVSDQESSKCLDPGSQLTSSSSSSVSLNQIASDSDPDKSKPSPSSQATKNNQIYLDESSLMDMLETCEKEGSYSLIIRTLGLIFSSPEAIAKSFQKLPKTSVDEILEKVPQDPKDLKKEDIRSLEGDLDKDEDCSDIKDQEEVEDPTKTNIDFPGLRRSMKKLYDTNSEVFGTLNNALESLATTLLVDLRISKSKEHLEETITVFIILFEIFQIGSGVLLEISVPRICSAVILLPVWAQVNSDQISSSNPLIACYFRLAWPKSGELIAKMAYKIFSNSSNN